MKLKNTLCQIALLKINYISLFFPFYPLCSKQQKNKQTKKTQFAQHTVGLWFGQWKINGVKQCLWLVKPRLCSLVVLIIYCRTFYRLDSFCLHWLLGVISVRLRNCLKFLFDSFSRTIHHNWLMTWKYMLFFELFLKYMKPLCNWLLAFLGGEPLPELPVCSWNLIPLSSLLPYRDCSSRPVKVTQTGSRYEKGRQTRKIFTYLIFIFKLVWPFQWLPLVIFYAAFENLSIWPTSKHSYSGLLKQGRENSSTDGSMWTQQLSSIPLISWAIQSFQIHWDIPKYWYMKMRDAEM